MSLQFIAGGSGSGKTRYLYEKVIKESEEHPDIQYLFIVPEQYTMQTQKELVRLHPRHGLLNIDVLSFKRLAYRVFEDLGVQLPQVLDDMGKSMVIRKVAGKLKKELKLYGGHLEQPGFINQLKSQISELCQYGVSVEDLAMVEEETDRVLLKDKLRDLKTVYGGFKDYIESHYITAEEILDILEELKKEGKLRYYGFSNYGTERLKEIEKCLRERKLPGITAVSNQWSLAGINPGGNTNPDPTLVEFSREEYQWHCETGAAAVPFSSTAMGFFSKLQKMGLSCTDAEVDASWMREKETQITGLSESMKRSYWNETNLRTYQKLLKLQKETGHSLQALSLAYFFHQPFQTVPVTGVSNPSQLKDVLDACEIDLASELFGGWVSAGG